MIISYSYCGLCYKVLQHQGHYIPIVSKCPSEFVMPMIHVG
uniref:Uncharacterized protein n=1 Tax=Arundo donax TaxID=35708 RepID=A0A0A9AHM8_ARUDO